MWLLVLHRMVPDEVLRARLPFRYAKSALESRIQAYGRVKKDKCSFNETLTVSDIDITIQQDPQTQPSHLTEGKKQ